MAFGLMRKWKRIFLMLLVVAAAAGGYYGYTVVQFFSDIQQPKIAGAAGSKGKQTEIPVWSGTERVNILLMGVDRRGMRPNETPRSDSMLIVSIDPVQKRFDLFSILRDTYVKIPGYGRSRINTALADGGPELAMQTVSEFSGLSIDRYVITDFEGFKSLIDAVGGVELEVEKNMRYRDPTDDGVYDIDLKKGFQRLDGSKALQYVRFRHDAMSDYTRTERQRKLLKALATQMKSGTTLIQLPSILQGVTPYVQTNINSLDMLKLAALGLRLDTEKTGQYQLPPMGAFRESQRGGSVLIPDVEQVQQFVQEKVNAIPTETQSPEETKQTS